MSPVVTKRRTFPVDSSNERARKRLRVEKELELEELAAVRELVAMRCNLQPSFIVGRSTVAITPSPVNHDDCDSLEETYACVFVDDLTHSKNDVRRGAAVMYHLQHRVGNEPSVPSKEVVLSQCMIENHKDYHCRPETDDSSGVIVASESIQHNDCHRKEGHSSKPGDESSCGIVGSIDTTVGTESCEPVACSKEIDNDDCAAATEMIVGKPKKRKSKYVWARGYFDKLMKEGHASSPGRHIHNLMQIKCGNEPVPTHSCVSNWLKARRKEDNDDWAPGFFDDLTEKGHVYSNNKHIRFLIQQRCENKPIPSQGDLEHWLTAKRKDLGKTRPQEEEFVWARGYFNKLMEEGNLESSIKTIHNLMQQHCGGEPVPTRLNVRNWLTVKRKEKWHSIRSGGH